ncbi:CDF family Co(II)/Ni(II) efflux transporter DmeF [Beggiatoa leptomitoformis]|uniref:CDF family Co(II)/Ni(II) efflux transporter DmeF n=1 Tax=Beggiatoa leptomitoformis TaxID=288004 RepID=A0A2N9YA77_9GAMM|nr:CDF family Co(II)/Ni(II) efflux transporter DmeF [Beggiatoa leptomitoformis]ALG67218.1 CDF family Co(II)/Ni(II) efflux transporter DmeF [Beggiatoa leptomitoformis]AUI67369.1 CDF family Co(II)/Ni(II) efflux transporter DmeF [Beggiatoa leptomitoformis]
MNAQHYCQYVHQFDIHNQEHERNTQRVTLLTLLMMVVEITAGLLYGSMALLADGLHMGTHALAIGITMFAYRYARHHHNDPQYSFGTGKVGVLGGFTSALILAIVALMIGIESVNRLFFPQTIQFNEAIIVAILGLIINLISAVWLDEGHDHHDDTHEHDEHTHHDHNLRAAYLHVLADALTSVLAIVALLLGKFFGWVWVDAFMGLIGTVVILKWSYGLLCDTSNILLDSGIKPEILANVRTTIEAEQQHRVQDLHVWRINANQSAIIISIVAKNPHEPAYYKKLLAHRSEFVHVTIEINMA